MNAAASLYSHLTADEGIQAIAGAHVYPLSVPQIEPGARFPPSLAYRMSHRREERALPPSWFVTVSTWEIAAIAEDYDSAVSLAEAVLSAMRPVRGPLGGEDGIDVMSCELVDASDDLEQELGLYMVLIEYTIRYR